MEMPFQFYEKLDEALLAATHQVPVHATDPRHAVHDADTSQATQAAAHASRAPSFHSYPPPISHSSTAYSKPQRPTRLPPQSDSSKCCCWFGRVVRLSPLLLGVLLLLRALECGCAESPAKAAATALALAALLLAVALLYLSHSGAQSTRQESREFFESASITQIHIFFVRMMIIVYRSRK